RCDPNSVLTVADCNFAQNVAGLGAGLYADVNSIMAVTDSVFLENLADGGLGGAMLWAGQMEISDCTVSHNTAGLGGGLFAVNSKKTTITRSLLTANRAGASIGDPNVAPDPNDPNTIIIIDVNIPLTIGQGGGMFAFSTPMTIRDTIMSYNFSDSSGGALYIAGNMSDANITNCLIISNAAGRDGGGISANWYARPYIANCTVSGNAAAGASGEPGRTGLGGGMYVSYHADCEVTDSIFWNNYSLKGHEMYVGTGFEHDPRSSRLVVLYSDIKDGLDDVFVDDGCTLIWGLENIDADPLFVAGILDDYYLSQVVSGQAADSPCVRTADPDPGITYVDDVGLVGYTTRTDGISDVGVVDMGYHRQMVQPCKFCDIDPNGKIDFFDFAVLAERWLDQGCSDADGWCGGADATLDAAVDFDDVAFMATCWLVEDNAPPVPDPAEWSVEPYLSGLSARMTAVRAVDMWGWPVEYYFECVRGDGDDSGWIESNEYTDGGLTPGVRYGYRVKARDTSPYLNETGWSEVVYAGEEDTTPPVGLMWIIAPRAVSHDTIVMIAYAEDASGVEYLFTNVTLGYDSGWREEPNWVDTGPDPNTPLVQDTLYCYTLRARDMSPAQHVSQLSGQACARTLIPPDTTPPYPAPTWDPNDPNLWPAAIFIGPDAWTGWGYTMTCSVAADPSGGVQYWFQCYEESTINSGWINVNTWTTPGFTMSGQNHGFWVKARDAFGNETAWSIVKRPREL
ncbi:MAG TPA: right-handed parallel beta-helix repeat-containing protein, partial [Sedimentisphaerales bacterium]|nr:right-handed parallel beta-helix repeat-containing protein [Sedimentisphaerales bacterium]